MKPPRSLIGLLMFEHRTIELVIARLCALADEMDAGAPLDPLLVDKLVDFLLTYADHTHHGKEEAILFRELGEKEMTAEDAAEMELLKEQHRFGRAQKLLIVEAKDRFCAGDDSARVELAKAARALGEMYPEHIKLEDAHFFRNAVGYFTPEEREALAAESREYDRMLIHEKYAGVAEELSGHPAG